MRSSLTSVIASYRSAAKSKSKRPEKLGGAQTSETGSSRSRVFGLADDLNALAFYVGHTADKVDYFAFFNIEVETIDRENRGAWRPSAALPKTLSLRIRGSSSSDSAGLGRVLSERAHLNDVIAKVDVY